MRNRKAQGFTLIELLIVIAIIGILAAVLIPNLMRARSVAVDRAAEGYVQNVYTAGNAWLAENVTQDAAAAATLVGNSCMGGAAFGQYVVAAPSFTQATCTVNANAAGTDLVITSTYTGGINNAADLP